MSKMNLHDDSTVKRAISPQAMTTVAGLAGEIIDRKGYNGVEFIVTYGAITATNATITPVVKHGDATGALTSVADTYLQGTESGAAIAAGARVDGSTENVSKKLGYTGNKRYVQFSIASATVTAAVNVSASALLFAPEVAE